MNTGERIQGAFSRAIGLKTGTHEDVWAQVFEVPSGPAREDQVVICLQALRSELLAAQAWLEGKGGKGRLISPLFERLLTASSVGRIHNAWNDYRGNVVAPEVLTGLEWLAWAMPEEASINDADLQAINQSIEALEKSASADGVAPVLRKVALDSVALLRNALRAYGIKGTAALDEALTKAAGTVALQIQEIQAEVEKDTPDSKSTYQNLKSALGKVYAVAKNAKDGIDTGKGLIQYGTDAMDAIAKLLQ
jgi:hypothetical protein